LAALGLALMFKSGSGAEDVGKTVAEAGVPPDIVEISSAGVRVRFDPGKLANGKDVTQYKLWRDHDIVVDVVDGTVLRDGKLFDDAAARSVTYVQPNPQTPTASSPDSVTSAVPALILGQPHVYSVSAVYPVRPTDATDPTWYETKRSFAGQATPLARIAAADLTASTKSQADVDLRLVDFGWKSTTGADEYIIEASVAGDPRFENPRYISQVKHWPPRTGGQTLVMENQNIASFFADLTEGDQIFWRVGARNSADKPGPVPSPKRRYIYSEQSVIVVREMPPLPPR